MGQRTHVLRRRPFHHRRENERQPYQKAIFYGLSTFPGLGRINNDEHYFSQVALGGTSRI